MKFQGLLKQCATKTTSGTYVLTWKLCQSWLGCKEVILIFVFTCVNGTTDRGTGIAM
jgi:hypothetical protein